MLYRRVRRAKSGFAAVQVTERAAVGGVVTLRWPQGIELDLPLALGETSLRRWMRELLGPCLVAIPINTGFLFCRIPTAGRPARTRGPLESSTDDIQLAVTAFIPAPMISYIPPSNRTLSPCNKANGVPKLASSATMHRHAARIPEACILMFSGGRDSTLSAIRLQRQFESLILVTVTSNHLTGIDAVRARLRELAPHLSGNTRWLHVTQPAATDVCSFSERTCLPCHRSYVATGVVIATHFDVRDLALGYVGYQNNWPEQTVVATRRLNEILDHHGIRLHLPVYDVTEKAAIIRELKLAGVTEESLEQKCLVQVNNRTLTPQALTAELLAWEINTRGAIDRLIFSDLVIVTNEYIYRTN